MNQKHNKFTRALAWLGILLLICLFLNLLYCAFTGKNFMASFYLVIIVPTIIWGGIVIFRAFSPNKDKSEEDDEN